MTRSVINQIELFGVKKKTLHLLTFPINVGTCWLVKERIIGEKLTKTLEFKMWKKVFCFNSLSFHAFGKVRHR